MNEIKLEFSYTEAEYLAAARLITLRGSDFVFRLILFYILIMVGASMLTGMLTELPWWTGGIASGLFLTLIYYNTLVKRTRQYFRGDAKFRDQQQLIFSDEGVAVKTPRVDAKVSWSLYTKYLEGSGIYVLVYGKDTRMMTVIPKRAFHDSLQENAFRELLSRHISLRSTSPGPNAKEQPIEQYQPTSLNPPDWR